jgi:hypothetical protein
VFVEVVDRIRLYGMLELPPASILDMSSPKVPG